jgi:chemotaxis family two-component system sensor kinase Cph1
MSHTQVQSSPPVDLTNCDREPIHLPGSIQPHGILLVLSEPDFIIQQISANTQTILNSDLAPFPISWTGQ